MIRDIQARFTVMRLATIIGVSTALLAVAFVALSFYITQQMIRPSFYEHRTPAMGLSPSEGSVNPQVDYAIAFESVEFPAADGQTLRGWFVPGDNPTSAVITVHGGGGDRRSYLSMLPSLHNAGYPVLLFDAREHGISDGKGLGISIGYREHQDVISAVDYLVGERGFKNIGAVGTSQGAISVMLAAAADLRISPVIAQSGATNLTDLLHANPMLSPLPRSLVHLFVTHFYIRQGADWDTAVVGGPGPIDVIKNISPRAVFLIHGDQDQLIPVDHTLRNFKEAGEPKTLWVVEGGEHRELRSYVGEEYDKRVIAFLGLHLGTVP